MDASVPVGQMWGIVYNPLGFLDLSPMKASTSLRPGHASNGERLPSGLDDIRGVA